MPNCLKHIKYGRHNFQCNIKINLFFSLNVLKKKKKKKNCLMIDLLACRMNNYPIIVDQNLVTIVYVSRI